MTAVGAWQHIWNSPNGARLWAIPDRAVVDVASRWQQSPGIRRVLDVGCGAGRHLTMLAAAGFDAYGVDNSPAGLERCTRLLHDTGQSAALALADMAAIPFPDGCFDAAVAFNAIYHGPRAYVENAARELHRCLRPGGECFITMPSRRHRLYGKGEQEGPHTFRSPGMFPGLFAHDDERGELHYFCSEEDIAAFFSGFHIISLDHEELNLAGAGGKLVRVPRSFFWRIRVRK